IFALASFTDMLDGKIARKRNLVTNFGKFMDPLADKLLVVTALLCLLIVDGGQRMCSNQIVALIAVLIVVAREFVISGFRLVASDNGVVIAASMWGKFKTATTMVAICLMIVVNELSEVAPFFKELTMILFWVAITLTIVSLVDYVVKNWTVMFAADKEVKPAKEENKETDNTPKFDPNTGEPLQ
ncbi:MAG: CDP-diacylglycerol--glycerol-3-phosphate 3-phosphatidyltransferase, partial [Lachnospiraceae bacterium]|nr:CDP-diacylglycerol--glycerol-3-phosphate 3-phosphatidyltransferase [Lachnospiraceae bacterium]